MKNKPNCPWCSAEIDKTQIYDKWKDSLGTIMVRCWYCKNFFVVLIDGEIDKVSATNGLIESWERKFNCE